MCGDATKPEHVERLLDGAKPDLMVTDPPYGVNYDASWRDGLGYMPQGERGVHQRTTTGAIGRTPMRSSQVQSPTSGWVASIFLLLPEGWTHVDSSDAHLSSGTRGTS